MLGEVWVAQGGRVTWLMVQSIDKRLICGERALTGVAEVSNLGCIEGGGAIAETTCSAFAASA
jgi:hypothetical protein